MDDEYGVKLTLDLTDLKKGVKEAKKEVESIKDVKVDGMDGDFIIDRSKLKGVKVDLKETTDAFEKLASVRDRIADNEIKITGLDQTEKEIQDISDTWNEYIEKTARPLETTQPTVFDIDTQQIEDKLDAVEQKASSTSINIKEKLSNAFSGLSGAIGKVKEKLSGLKKTSDKVGSNLQKNFEKGLKSLKKFAMALFGVQTAYRIVTRAMNAYLQYDEQLSDSIQDTWAGLGSFLAPILEYLVSAFQKLLSYINAVVTALTGINFVARANAKAMANAGKNAKKAGKEAKQSLASFDEINNINQPSGASGGEDVKQIELADVDQSFVDKIIDGLQKVKDFMLTLFEPIGSAWEAYGTPFIESVKYAFGELFNLGKSVGESIFEVWTNGTGQQQVELLLSIFTRIFNTIGNIALAFDNAWQHANQGTNIVQNIWDIVNSILEFVDSIGQSFEEWTISDSFQEAIDHILKIVQDITGWVKEVVQWFVDMYKKYLKGVVDELLGLISDVVNLIGAIWNVLKPVVDKAISVIKKNLEPVIRAVTDIIKGIIEAIRGVIQIITGALQGNWDKVWNGMKKTVKGVINGIIGFFNSWVDGLNAFLIPVRGLIVMIGKAFGKKVSLDSVKIPHIPKLKIGTDNVYEDGLAYLHKGEKVVPANVAKGGYTDNSDETNSLLRQLIDAVNEKDYNPYITVDDIGKASVNYIRKKSRIEGEAII